MRRNSFTPRGCWISLPKRVVETQTISKLKTEIDIFWDVKGMRREIGLALQSGTEVIDQTRSDGMTKQAWEATWTSPASVYYVLMFTILATLINQKEWDTRRVGQTVDMNMSVSLRGNKLKMLCLCVLYCLREKSTDDKSDNSHSQNFKHMLWIL